MSLAKISGLDHMALAVSDLEKSIQFYEEVFGFEMKEDQRDENWAIIGIKGRVYLCLYQQEEVEASANSIYHWGFHVEGSLNELSRALQAKGIKVKNLDKCPDGVWEYPASQSLYIYDPDDYAIELSSVCGGGLN